MADAAQCPWCGFSTYDAYAVQLHIEEQHTDDSPFAIKKPSSNDFPRGGPSIADFDARSESGERWIKCTRRGCGQYVAEANIDDHVNMHDAAFAHTEPAYASSSGTVSPRVLNGTGYARPQVSGEKAPSQISLPKSSVSSKSGSWRRPSIRAQSVAPSSVSGKSRVSRASSDKARSEASTAKTSVTSKSGAPSSVYSGSSVGPQDALKDHPRNGRLGTKDLGPYAYEKGMPIQVRRVLENASKPSYECRIGPDGRLVREAIIYNQTPRPVPVLADLSAADPNIDIAYFCHKSVKHVHRLKCDGNFCGYWNIQMLLSYRLARIEDPAHGSLPLPSVLEIQDTIEAAWDAGICSFGRTETGGIRNTRKWIGTHEAAAYFLKLGQPVTALSFKTSPNPKAPSAHSQLLDYVEAYFISGLEGAAEKGSSRMTGLPPIYFQRPGHSMTIVGMEKRNDGDRVLLVFDPSFAVAEMLRQLRNGRVHRSKIDTLMAAFRQDGAHLTRWREYEIMM
jgi:hypothetical protein